MFGRQSEWEHFPSTGSCPTWPQWLELSQANQEPWAPSVFHMGGKGPMTWAICCFPMCIRELDGKWSQLEHWTGAHMECWYCRWQLQLLCSSLIPLFYLDSGCSTASCVCSCFVIFFFPCSLSVLRFTLSPTRPEYPILSPPGNSRQVLGTVCVSDVARLVNSYQLSWV